jgi:hypothetical protein
MANFATYSCGVAPCIEKDRKKKFAGAHATIKFFSYRQSIPPGGYAGIMNVEH